MATICFSHGKESGPLGTKIRAMTEVAVQLGHQTMSIDYRGMDDPGIRVNKLLVELKNVSQPIVLVGSSMGAYVSIVASQDIKPKGLFLLAPAVYLDGYNTIDLLPQAEKIFIIHGWNDEIVAYKNVVKFAEKFKADLYLCDDDHPLSSSIELIQEQFKRFLAAI